MKRKLLVPRGVAAATNFTSTSPKTSKQLLIATVKHDTFVTQTRNWLREAGDDRQTKRQTDKQRDRQTERHTDRRYLHSSTWVCHPETLSVTEQLSSKGQSSRRVQSLPICQSSSSPVYISSGSLLLQQVSQHSVQLAAIRQLLPLGRCCSEHVYYTHWQQSYAPAPSHLESFVSLLSHIQSVILEIHPPSVGLTVKVAVVFHLQNSSI